MYRNPDDPSVMAWGKWWYVEDGPRIRYPDYVLYEDEPWHLIEVDVLGRWLCERYDVERYLDPADLEVALPYDQRPHYGCRDRSVASPIDNILHEVYLPALRAQLEQPSYFLTLLEK
jgi:hypothetical protein